MLIVVFQSSVKLNLFLLILILFCFSFVFVFFMYDGEKKMNKSTLKLAEMEARVVGAETRAEMAEEKVHTILLSFIFPFFLSFFFPILFDFMGERELVIGVNERHHRSTSLAGDQLIEKAITSAEIFR